jgi:RNA recognition motif-containing protein
MLQALKNPNHYINGKIVECKEALPKTPLSTKPSSNESLNKDINSSLINTNYYKNKIFVGGLGDLNENIIESYFSKYGKIEKILLMKDPNTKKSRGFGFIIFVDEESIELILSIPKHIINFKVVDCKRSYPKNHLDTNVFDVPKEINQMPNDINIYKESKTALVLPKLTKIKLLFEQTKDKETEENNSVFNFKHLDFKLNISDYYNYKINKQVENSFNCTINNINKAYDELLKSDNNHEFDVGCIVITNKTSLLQKELDRNKKLFQPF